MSLKCKTCGTEFESEAADQPCPSPSPGRPYVDTGKGNHIFDVKHFAQLTPVEHEMISCASEEAAEIGMIIGKALRHGIDSCHPATGSKPNRFEIAREIGQLIAVMQIMCDVGVIHMLDVEAGRLEKFAKIGKYLHHVRIDGERALIVT